MSLRCAALGLVGFVAVLVAGCGLSDLQPSESASPTIVGLPTPITVLPTAPPSPTSSSSLGVRPSITATMPAAPEALSSEPIAARVNGVAVSLAEFNKQVAAAEAFLRSQGTDLNSADGRERSKQLRQQVLDQLIEQVLIEQSAIEMGLKLSEAQLDSEVQKAISDAGGQAQFERWLVQNQLTRDEFRRSLRSNLLGAQLRDKVVATTPERAEQIHARHILVDSKPKADQLLARLRAGVDFATLARQNSLDVSTRDNGGDLGWFPRGLMLPEFEKVAFGLSKGQVSGVVQTAFGYHIIQLLDRDANRIVSAEIQQALRENAFTHWLDSQKAKAKIERFVE